MNRAPRLLAGPLALAAGVAVGCGPKDEVRTYQVPKSPAPADAPPVAPAAPATPSPAGGEYRILGAMFPADDPTWFFKLTGPAAAVTDVEPAFDQFLASVRFPDPAKPPQYDLPAGWKSTGPDAARMAADAITLGPPDRPLRLTVTSVRGGVAGNVKRWADQVGATGDPAQGLRDVTTAAGAKGVRAALAGPKNPAGGMTPPFMRGK